VTAAATIDVAGGPAGGAARFRTEVSQYLERRARVDVKVIGMGRRLNPAWLVSREVAAQRRSRRVALNNVGFFVPGGERWTLLANALHFLTDAEIAALDRPLATAMGLQTPVVHRAARRSDVLIAPCTAMAERIATALPEVAERLVVRMHPVSPNPAPHQPAGRMILCPVVFYSYKNMTERLTEWLAAVDDMDPAVRMAVTARPEDVPAELATSPRFDFVGTVDHAELSGLWARCRAVYFPSGLESFGFPLAEARVNGQPVIARDIPQNREIAGPALRGFAVGNLDSLRQATELALTMANPPDPEPFAPDAYFDWMLGARI